MEMEGSYLKSLQVLYLMSVMAIVSILVFYLNMQLPSLNYALCYKFTQSYYADLFYLLLECIDRRDCKGYEICERTKYVCVKDPDGGISRLWH